MKILSIRVQDKIDKDFKLLKAVYFLNQVYLFIDWGLGQVQTFRAFIMKEDFSFWDFTSIWIDHVCARSFLEFFLLRSVKVSCSYNRACGKESNMKWSYL